MWPRWRWFSGQPEVGKPYAELEFGTSVDTATSRYITQFRKLAEMDRHATDVLQNSLLPGQKEPLKTRPDGTILDGHHRIYILRRRGVDVDALPREIVVKGGL
jgi:hypothetical protein